MTNKYCFSNDLLCLLCTTRYCKVGNDFMWSLEHNKMYLLPFKNSFMFETPKILYLCNTFVECHVTLTTNLKIILNFHVHI